MKFRHSLTALAVIFAAGLASTVITACSGSASAADSVTMAQVNAAIAAAVNPLKQQIGDQQNQIDALKSAGGSDAASHLYLTISAPNAHTEALHPQAYGASGSGLHTEATDPTCSGLGTLTGHPTSSDPRTSDLLAGVSCTGYLFNVTAAQAGQTSHVADLKGAAFAQPDCQGPAYYDVRSVSELAKVSGVVFALPSEMVSDWSDPSVYFYLPPNPTPTTITEVSGWDPAAPNGCAAMSPATVTVYEALPNDPTVTAIPSGLIPGPVGMGTAAGG